MVGCFDPSTRHYHLARHIEYGLGLKSYDVIWIDTPSNRRVSFSHRDKGELFSLQYPTTIEKVEEQIKLYKLTQRLIS